MSGNVGTTIVNKKAKINTGAFNAPGLKKLFYNLISLGIFVAIWSLLASLFKSSFFPTPDGVVNALVNLIVHGDLEGYTLWEHTWVSTVRIAAGFFVALIMGVPLGLLMGLYPTIYERTSAIIEPIRFIPPIAWVPMAIVLLVGFSRYVFLIWLGAFFPIFINTMVSVPRVDPIWKDVVKVYGGNRSFIIKKVVFPAVLPDIFAGMRVSLGVAWMCIVAAEMIGGETVGLGRLILKYADLMRMNEVVVGMLFIGLIGFILNEVLIRIEKRLFRWRAEVSL
ncbi:ABC transporter permease [Desulfofundulus sp. TPOSR]|uniref:ABC transporter permease n=1 Tax=Desulfofundulus sp. TPOSR TaxID=2714340 RepID=UPI00140E02A1|nr:ABC transporter permease [Desulfofundulus sp. TPOSR]NHM28764.1 ABC transporter permease [Desulfofundulus sp. TPOSR]